MNYDLMVSDCKHAVLAELLRVQREHPGAEGHLPTMFDQLNEAWDKLTDCLVRHRSERDKVIQDLINQLAEAKKR